MVIMAAILTDVNDDAWGSDNDKDHNCLATTSNYVTHTFSFNPIFGDGNILSG